MDEQAIAALVRTAVREALAEEKGASGSTSLPLSDRDAAWDGNEAHNRVVAWASDADGNLVASKMKQAHFWYDDSAPDQITSYKLIFADVVDGKLTANFKGITGCAGALNGARGTGVDIPEGDVAAVKAKIATWYGKAAKQYDDDTIKPPWEQGEKGAKPVNERTRARKAKDFATLQSQEEIEDTLWEDWWDMQCHIREAIFGALADDSVTDKVAAVTTSLDQYKQAALAWVARADASGVFADEDAVGYLAARLDLESKAGRAMSAANHNEMSARHKELKAAHKEMGKTINSMGTLLDKLKPSNASQDDSDSDTSNNTTTGNKGKTGAGAGAHTTGDKPAGATEQTTPDNEMVSAFHKTLELARSFAGVHNNGTDNA